MTFLDLLAGAEVLAQSGNPQVTGVEYDSRRVKPGNVFVAMRGEASDGNRFLSQAIRAGAVAVVTDSDETPRDVAWARVAHGRRALAVVSQNFYGHPAGRLALTGITGTNGKSTTAFSIESILSAAGRKCALVGTIEYHVAGKVLPAPHTTPEALELQRIFRQAADHGASEVVMEVSSHALAQGRTYGIPFEVGVFTNLTRDHLDYHATMEEYFAAKRILFERSEIPEPRCAVLNVDDEAGVRLAKFSKGQSSRVITYGLLHGDVHATQVEITAHGTRFRVVTPDDTIPVDSRLIGRVNVYNILAAIAVAYARGCSSHAIAEGVRTLARVPGRFERVDCGQAFTVVVDYAHTDDALRNLTALAREFVKASGGRVITVFGCGGDRDRSKRPLMGEAAGKGSDFVVVTSDNPRSEDPANIVEDALPGLRQTRTRHAVELDRKKAIRLALIEAMPGDMVLIAGKGHEKYQITREGTFPFDDTEVAAEALADLGYERGRTAAKLETRA